MTGEEEKKRRSEDRQGMEVKGEIDSWGERAETGEIKLL